MRAALTVSAQRHAEWIESAGDLHRCGGGDHCRRN